MVTRPNPVKDLLDGIITTFTTANIGIETVDHKPITVARGPNGDPIEDYIRGTQSMPLLWVRCERVGLGTQSFVGEEVLDVEFGCYYFQAHGREKDAAADAYAVLLRALQAVGNQLADPDAPTNLFGVTATPSRTIGIKPIIGNITVRPLTPPREEADAGNAHVTMGEYHFAIEYALNINGEVS